MPDTSVVVAAYFNETTSREAQRLLNAVERQSITGFASPILAFEFLKVAEAKRFGRGRRGEDVEVVDEQVETFMNLDLIPMPELQIRVLVWALICEERISTPDAWMLATAMFTNAELWLTHDHADGFVAAARRVHPAVFTLADDRADIP